MTKRTNPQTGTASNSIKRINASQSLITQVQGYENASAVAVALAYERGPGHGQIVAVGYGGWWMAVLTMCALAGLVSVAALAVYMTTRI